MSEPVNLQTIYPLIVTPSHDGKFFQNYVLSIVDFFVQAQQLGMRSQMLLHHGESLITRARNNCVAQFLAHPEYTHLFWIDADIGFSAEAAFRLLRSGYDICAGIYPLKRENWPQEGVPAGTTQQSFEASYTHYTANTGAPNDGDVLNVTVQPDGFLKVDQVPTGFMLIKRSVFEQMIAAYPDYQYVPDNIGVADQGLHYRFFDVAVDPQTRRYLSEDYGFCQLWKALGGSIYADANSTLSHQGFKMYQGNFAAALTHALPYAIFAPVGTKMYLHGAEYLAPNPRGP